MHESVEKQYTAILQRAGEERRCTEMERRGSNAVLSTGAYIGLAKCTTGDARGQRERRTRRRRGRCKDYMSNWLHLDFFASFGLEGDDTFFCSLRQQVDGELQSNKSTPT